MREYLLAASPRSFAGPNPDAGVPAPSGEDGDDFISMHRAVGDQVLVQSPGHYGHGTVVRIVKGNALIQFGSKWYQESGQKITEVEPSVCDLCLAFPCACTQPSPNQPMTPTPFSELAAKTAAKTPIECVEGKLTTLYDPKEYASGINVGKQYQNGEITSGGLKIKLKIDSPDLILPQSRRNQTIRIESKQGTKGISGVYYEVGEYQGKEQRTIRLTGTAIISFPGDSGTSHANATGSGRAYDPVHTPKSDWDAPQRSSEPSRAIPDASGQAVFEIALSDYYKAFEKVCRQFDKDPATIAQELTAEKIAEITTAISMASTRGQYGAYIGYRWADGSHSVSDAPVEPEGSPVSAPLFPNNSWQEAQNSKHVKIKDMDDATFLRAAKWAYAPVAPAIPDGPLGNEARRFQAAVLMGCGAKKMTPRTVFLSSFAATEGVGEFFDDNDLESVVGDRFSKPSSNLTNEEWKELLIGFAGVIEDCKSAHVPF